MNSRERKQLLQSAESYFRSGNPAMARMALESLVAVDATSSRAFELLGYVYGNEGRLADAQRCLEKASQLPRPSPETFHYLGVSLLKQGRAEPAIRAFDKALALAGPFFEALHERGTAYSRLGRNARALESYLQAAKLRPASFDLVFNIGKVCDALEDHGQALAWYDRALALDPTSAEALAHRGAALFDAGRYAEAIESWDRALALDPQIEHLPGFRLHAKLRLCDWRDWALERSDVLARFEAGENVCGPFEMLAISGDEAVQARCARRWAETHGGGGTRDATGSVVDAAGAGDATAVVAAVGEAGASEARDRPRIRIGYFSADFGRHAVSYLAAELCELHDRESFEVFGFATSRAAPDDEMRARLARAFDHFVDAADLADAEIVERARSAGLDIAVDLGGHTKGSRTGVFRDRVAPVQVNYLGYPGTMGAGFADYMIADETTIPGPSRMHYTEKIVWLPDCFQPSDTRRAPAGPSRPRSSFGLPDDGFVFCCFNNTYKINPEVFAHWANILRAVDGACLWLLAEADVVKGHLRAEAARLGIDPDRLVFGGRLPMNEYLERYRHADLFLDTLPFNAGATANDALLAGLPVLTHIGDAFAGRMAASLLKTLGLPELVAGSWNEYESSAIRLAGHPEELRQIRSRLAQGRADGPLFDMPRYARRLEEAYRAMVRRTQQALPPDHLRVPA